MTEYETVIGLESHAQLLTRTKMFCSCLATFGSPPNTNVCPVCLGLPGALPVLNREAVTLAVRMALAVGCNVGEISVFARKNYFYPDLPKGYQISQYDRPLAEAGSVSFDLDGESKRIRIERIHMEEDAGKLLHEGFPSADRKSGVDFNRSGVPLIEIVTEPEMSSPAEAIRYAQALKEILEYTGVSDADMEKGNFRCDGNISIRPKGSNRLGTKVEIKNLNSFRFLERALAREVERQIELIDSGAQVVQETRLYDPGADLTVSMRSKEEAHDYRYFPEPDLPPLRLEAAFLSKLASSLPELPANKRARLAKDYGLPAYDAEVLTTSRELADYFEAAAKASGNAKAASNWVMSELLRQLKQTGGSIANFPVNGISLGSLIRLVDEGKISGQIAKDIFEKMIETGDEASAIIDRESLGQISDMDAIEELVRTLIGESVEQVEAFKSGNEKILGWMVGQIMRASKGKANPQLVRETLLRILGET